MIPRKGDLSPTFGRTPWLSGAVGVILWRGSRVSHLGVSEGAAGNPR